MTQHDEDPGSWLAKGAMAYAMAIIYAIGAFFLLSDSTGSLTAFLSSIPHYPMRGLRALHLEGVTSGVSAASEHVVHVLRWHLYLLALIAIALPFVIGALIVIIDLIVAELDLGRGWRIASRLVAKLLGLVLVVETVAICSVLLAGLHLVRAHDRWVDGSRDGDAMMKDLMFANEPSTFGSARATLTRFFAMSERASPRPRNALEIKLNALADELERAPRSFTDNDPTILAVWPMVVFQIGISLHEISELAFEGRGGDGGQAWRELRFAGPAGSPIRIRTNFLPPDQRAKPLLGRNATLDQVWNEFEIKSNAAYAAPWGAPCKASTTALLAAGSTLSPDDVLVRVAYGMISSYCTTRAVFEAMLPGAGFSTHDSYGELVITLHNSQNSYNGAVSKDLPGSGLYIPGENQMVVWEDERAATKTDALSLLDIVEHQIADKVQYIDWRHDPKALETIARRTERGFQQVIPHEASHWVLHTLLTGVLANDEPLTPCLDEGFAVNIDLAERQVVKQLARRAGASTSNDSKATDWPRFWFDEGVDVASTPADSVAMAAQNLYEGETAARKHAYAECYVLARLFGGSILAGAIKHGRGLAAELDDLHVPWRVIRRDIASGRAHLPADLAEEFRAGGAREQH